MIDKKVLDKIKVITNSFPRSIFYYDRLGFSLILLRKKSKIPINKGWTQLPKANAKDLIQTYGGDYSRFNLGVRLGRTSQINGYYLAALDVDIRSDDFRKQAYSAAGKNFQRLLKQAPFSKSGRGFGSAHYFFLTKEPIRSFTFAKSSELVKVYSPTSYIGKKDEKLLTNEELVRGFRMKSAWEIDVMGEGKQVVLPPSLHPDTDAIYSWGNFPVSSKSFPVEDAFTFKKDLSLRSTQIVAANQAQFTKPPFKKGYNLSNIVNLKNYFWRDLILKGEGTAKYKHDKSSYLYAACLFLQGQEIFKTEDELISVFIDKNIHAGLALYEHLNKKGIQVSEEKAADWVRKYLVQATKRKMFQEKLPDQKVFKERVFEKKLKNIPIEKEEEFEKELKSIPLEKVEHVEVYRPKDTIKLSDVKEDWLYENIAMTKEKQIKKTLVNTYKIIKEGYGSDFIIKDVFSGFEYFNRDIEEIDACKGEQIHDKHLVSIKAVLGSGFNFEPSVDLINEAVSYLVNRNKFHPIKNYIEGLEWDGVQRVKSWLVDIFFPSNPVPYLEAVGTKLLVAMVARVFDPGCKFDHVIILEGAQEIGKSTCLKILSEPWYQEGLDPKLNKDTLEGMQGKWLIELGELAILNKLDMESLKQFITRQVDFYRPPYGRKTLHNPRQSVFVGTTNRSEYLRDITGNRRFWPVVCTRADFKRLEEIKDQLFAEAYQLYKQGEKLFIEDEVLKENVVSIQKSKMESDVLSEPIYDFLNSKENNLPKDGFTLSELFVAFNNSSMGMEWDNLSYKDRKDQLRVANILRSLGIEKQKFAKGKKHGVHFVKSYWGTAEQLEQGRKK